VLTGVIIIVLVVLVRLAVLINTGYVMIRMNVRMLVVLGVVSQVMVGVLIHALLVKRLILGIVILRMSVLV